MIRKATSVTIWNDAAGRRMSISYTDIDETTGKIISDNNRIDRVVTDAQMKAVMDDVEEYAQNFIDAL